jgi:hypothetical protein
MTRIAVRLILAALLALISAQAGPVSFEQPRPSTAGWHRTARRTILAPRRLRTFRATPVAAPDYFFPVRSHTFEFGLFVRPPPSLL